MLKERNRVLKKVTIMLDVIITAVAFGVTFILREWFPHVYKMDIFSSMHVLKPVSLNINDYVVIYCMLTLAWSVLLSWSGMYRSMRIRSFPEIAGIIIKAAFFVVVIFANLVFLFKMQFVSRIFFVAFMVLTTCFLMLEKIIIFSFLRRSIKRGYNNVRLLMVGTGQRAAHLVDEIRLHPEWGYKIVRTADFRECLLCRGKEIKECEVISNAGDMRRILHSEAIDEVIFVEPRSRLQMIEECIYVCEEEGVDTAVAVDFFEIKTSMVHHTDIDGIPLITFERSFDKEWQLFFKRTFDIIVSGVGLIILSPFLLPVAILIKITSPGPVFFGQKRIGLHGRKFTMYKFRSMHKNAEKEREKLESLNEMEGPAFKIKDDPRITPFGRFLRRTSVDELPQLFNVFIGKMSLVGPRPALEQEVKQYETWERKRFSVRPGVTCLWQIHHRGESDFVRWAQSDLEYIDSWSLRLDLKIFFKTIAVVISEKGAR